MKQISLNTYANTVLPTEEYEYVYSKFGEI